MATKHNFTNPWIKNQKPNPSGRECFIDTGFKAPHCSLVLYVLPSGKKSFRLRYRGMDKKQHEVTIGHYGNEFGVKAAREKATRIAADLDTKKDPLQRKREVRRAETFREAAQLYHEKRALVRQTARTAKDRWSLLERKAIPLFGGELLQNVKRSMILDLLHQIEVDEGKPCAAKKLQATLFAVFRYAIEREFPTENPCLHLEPRSEGEPRRTILADEQIKQLFEALEMFSPRVRNVFKLTLLTGQRPGEVCSMEWDDLSPDGVWTIPASKNKSRREHLIPLPPVVLEILEEQREQNEAHYKVNIRRSLRAGRSLGHFERYVFPGRRAGHLANYNKALQRLRKEFSLPHFTAHDLRRTARTNFSKLKIPFEIRERILNHAPKKLVDTYDQYDFLDEKREALVRWSERVNRILSGESERKVVPIRAAS